MEQQNNQRDPFVEDVFATEKARWSLRKVIIKDSTPQPTLEEREIEIARLLAELENEGAKIVIDEAETDC